MNFNFWCSVGAESRPREADQRNKIKDNYNVFIYLI